jgi:hypothetical protein
MCSKQDSYSLLKEAFLRSSCYSDLMKMIHSGSEMKELQIIRLTLNA